MNIIQEWVMEGQWGLLFFLLFCYAALLWLLFRWVYKRFNIKSQVRSGLPLYKNPPPPPPLEKQEKYMLEKITSVQTLSTREYCASDLSEEQIKATIYERVDSNLLKSVAPFIKHEKLQNADGSIHYLSSLYVGVKKDKSQQ